MKPIIARLPDALLQLDMLLSGHTLAGPSGVASSMHTLLALELLFLSESQDTIKESMIEPFQTSLVSKHACDLIPLWQDQPHNTMVCHATHQ
jgi:hypothetical protein